MSGRTTGLMGVRFEKVAGVEDAPFFQNVMDALLEARAESEAQGRLQEARVWFERRGPFENQDLAWASDRIAMLQQMVENSGRVVAVDRRST